MGAQRQGRTDANSGNHQAGPEPSANRTVEGHSFWQTQRDGRTLEMNTRDDLALAQGRASWQVTPLTGVRAGAPIESDSPVVLRYLSQVVAEKERVTRPPRPPRPPVPKPTRKMRPALPAHAPVPCPLCRPDVGGARAAEPWPDCEVCDGAGVVSVRQAEEWHDRTGFGGPDPAGEHD
jgi:hypothetical protein